MSSDRQVQAEAWAASPLAILTLNHEGVIQFANPAAERIFSMRESELQGTPLTHLAHELDAGALQFMLDEVRQGRVPTRQEMRFQTETRDDIITGLSLAPTVDHPGWSVSVLRDLRKEKAFRPQLLHTERMATMGSIASVVAHELNNALAGALGCLDFAMQNKGDPRKLLETTREELIRSSELVLDLKEFARVDDELGDHIVIKELFRRLERLHSFQQADVAFSIEIGGNLSNVRGNTNQLIQAMLNLLRNAEHAAAKQAGERPPHVRMSATQNADVVHLEVADNGPGIPADQRGSIFDPFYSTKPAGEGTGLGLTVVQAIATAHQGRVECLETPGGGATFRLVIPTSNDTAKEEPPVPAEPLPDLSGVRVLVAEDEPAIRRFLERAFDRWEADALIVDDATRAIDAAAHEDFDTVLLDVRMPGGGGVEAYRKITDLRPQLATRIVFMTGELSSEMSEIVGQPYSGVLQKPFSLGDLKRAIHAALEPG